jgi:predicted type IV restriction endonuclease
MKFENGLENLRKLIEDYSPKDRLEAATRFQIIDRLLFDCLGWSKSGDCEVEDKEDHGYADYLLKIDSQNIFILEAKRESETFELPNRQNDQSREVKIKNIIKDNTNLKKAIDQVCTYCGKRGAPIAAICNGRQIAIFLGARIDGIKLYDGNLIFFDSLEDMEEDFQLLWQLISRDGIIEQNSYNKLTKINTTAIPPKISSFISLYPRNINRNNFQNEMNTLSENFLENITTLNEKAFLEKCYYEPNSLSQYALVAKNILETRYKMLEHVAPQSITLKTVKSKNEKTQNSIEISTLKKPILIIGDVGVGKTTFLKNLMLVTASAFEQDTIYIHIDLGYSATMHGILNDIILDEIENTLYSNHNIDINELSFVYAVYHSDLVKFRRSIDFDENDPNSEKKFLRSKIGTRRDNHIKKSIEHIKRSMHKNTIIFIDNADQRSDEIQEKAFLISQEINRDWDITVFITLRPDTYYRTSKRGALSGYHSQIFTISPPRLDMVINKRIEYALEIVSGSKQELAADVHYNLNNIKYLLNVLKDSLKRNKDLNELLENISAGNIRKALDYIKQFLGSAHVDTEKIVNIYISEGEYIIPTHEMIRSIIYGNYRDYDPNSSVIFNLFDIQEWGYKNHFLNLLILNYVHDEGKTLKDGFIEKESLVINMGKLGFSFDNISKTIIRLISKNLLDIGVTSSSREDILINNQLRITTLGLYHTKRLVFTFNYMDAVIYDTPIINSTLRGEINHNKHDIITRIENSKIFIEYMTQSWDKSSITTKYLDWLDIQNKFIENITEVEHRATLALRKRGLL